MFSGYLFQGIRFYINPISSIFLTNSRFSTI